MTNHELHHSYNHGKFYSREIIYGIIDNHNIQIMRNGDSTNKVCVVTGGSAGIGAACVSKFLAQGYTYLIWTLRHWSWCAHALWCDWWASSQTINDVHQQTGRIDALVCNAGIHFSSNIENTTEAEFDRAMDINVKGMYYALQATLPFMKAANTGRIVLMGSDQSLVAKPNSFAYNLSKFAVVSMAKTTALDYAQYNISVNAVAGNIDTPLLHKALDSYCQRAGLDKRLLTKKKLMHKSWTAWPSRGSRWTNLFSRQWCGPLYYWKFTSHWWRIHCSLIFSEAGYLDYCVAQN